jgi:PTH2 family peptidyl-tRNA hydrolase
MQKQVIVVRSDLKLSRGKLAVQVAHASLAAFLKTNKKESKTWIDQGAKKIVLKVSNLPNLLALELKAKAAGLPTALIRDAGLTELKPGTITALGIGPGSEKKINKITGQLKLIR